VDGQCIEEALLVHSKRACSDAAFWLTRGAIQGLPLSVGCRL
jgi:hypothetical protein